MVRIAIIEDEVSYQEQLRGYIMQYGEENGEHFQLTIFGDGMDITENYSPVWDIIFMDIKMKHMDGMEAAAKIRQYDKAAIIIFITAMAQYAIKGYEVEALDFVLKPFVYSQFAVKMQKALNLVRRMEDKYLLLSIEDRKERVSMNEILFIEVKNHNLYVVARNQTYVMRYSMREMEKELQAYHFERCNSAYLVNLKNVTGLQGDLVLVEQYELPVSRSRKKQFLKALSDFIGVGYK